MKRRILAGLVLSFVASLGVYSYALAKETTTITSESSLGGELIQVESAEN